MPDLCHVLADKSLKIIVDAFELEPRARKLSGYGLRVTASGVRSFVAQGRINRKAVITTIGRYGLFTEDAARKKAQNVLLDMRDGISPREVKKADAAAKVSLQDVLEAYVGRPGKMSGSPAPLSRTARSKRTNWSRCFSIRPAMEKRPR